LAARNRKPEPDVILANSEDEKKEEEKKVSDISDSELNTVKDES
jgi:hypothetical protein